MPRPKNTNSYSDSQFKNHLSKAFHGLGGWTYLAETGSIGLTRISRELEAHIPRDNRGNPRKSSVSVYYDFIAALRRWLSFRGIS